MTDLEQISAQLDAVTKERDSLVGERNRLERRLAEITQVVEALVLAKRVLERMPELAKPGMGAAAAAQAISGAVSAATGRLDLLGLNMPQSLMKLLEGRGGQAKISDLAGDLETSGRLKLGKRRSNYSRIYRTLTDRPQTFEKVGAGEYRLISANGTHANDGG